MKYLFLLAFLLIPGFCSAYEVNSKQYPIKTDKVSHLYGVVDETMAKTYFTETAKTLALPGPHVVLINSLGGRLDFGQVVIDMIEAEKAHGVQVVCVVEDEATSMAFNILTHCSVRLAHSNSRFLVHQAALGEWVDSERPTAKNLRKEANTLDRWNEPYRAANMKAMHLSAKEYDDYADEEKTWTTQELMKLVYLDGYVK